MNYLDRPWFVSYKLGPYKLDQSLAPYPRKPVSDILDQAALEFPRQTAILFKDKEVKYSQLKKMVDTMAAAFYRLGLQKGDRVSVYLPNCPEYVLSYWAVIRAGGVVVPISILRTFDGLFHEVNSSNSRFLICQEGYLDQATTLLKNTDLQGIVIVSNAGYDDMKIQANLPKGVYDFNDLITDQGSTPPQIDIDPVNDLCELAFTGGATGVPKGVMISHASRYTSVIQTIPWLLKPLLSGIRGKTSVLLSIPMFHVYGNFVQTTAIYLGLRLLILPDSRDTNAMLTSIIEHRPFLVPGVPTQFMRLADAGLKRSNSMLFSGSAPLPGEVAHEIKRKTGMPISEGYGLTESASVSHINLTAFSRITGFLLKDKPGIGVPLPDTDCRLVDPDTGLDVPVGQPGEVVLHGPQMMTGYWPERGSGLTSDGWLHTGDIAIMDETGYFQIVDRIKDMINISGLKVYTTEVDEVLFKHPGISTAAAFGIPDVNIPGSERVMAVVALKESHRGSVTEQEIRDFCRQHLPPYAVPKIIEFRDELPLTVTEKVFKNELRQQAIAKQNAQKEA